jgi:pyruvate dehydrogenase E2 component (dihydrolipoamide acetyltransferase)
MAEFKMPSLGADMEEGTLVQWNVKPGDPVKRGDIIAIVGTEKADIEVEVYQTGTIEKLIAQPGEKLPVGAVLALLHTEGEAPAAPKEAEVPPEKAPAKKAPPKKAAAPAPPAARAEAALPKPAARVRASPMARKLAEELGVDLATVEGTGPHGVIERHDVERAAEAKTVEAPPAAKPVVQQPAAPPAERPPVAATGMRRAIAAAMARSNREIPHYYVATQIDMSKSLEWLEQLNQRRPIQDRVLPAALLLKAVARALVQVPEFNGYWTEDRLQASKEIHIGVAISLRQGGLVIPAIHNTDQKSVEELMAAMRDVITRARGGRLRSSEITDGTITVTNLGDLGVESVFGVIYPPQVALVGFGRITERPWAEKGLLGVRPILTASLAADHRATDGRRGAHFLEVLNHLLQEPEKL